MAQQRKFRLAPIGLDLVVIRAAELIDLETRLTLLEKLQQLHHHTAPTNPDMRGFWLLVFTKTSNEIGYAYALTNAVSLWCQGVRTVTETTAELTAQAILDFHQLHFPCFPLQKRASHIQLLEIQANRTSDEGKTEQRSLKIDRSFTGRIGAESYYKRF